MYFIWAVVDVMKLSISGLFKVLSSLWSSSRPYTPPCCVLSLCFCYACWFYLIKLHFELTFVWESFVLCGRWVCCPPTTQHSLTIFSVTAVCRGLQPWTDYTLDCEFKWFSCNSRFHFQQSSSSCWICIVNSLKCYWENNNNQRNID